MVWSMVMSASQPSVVNPVNAGNTTHTLVLAGVLSMDALIAMAGYYFGFPYHDGPALFLGALSVLFAMSLPLRLRCSITTGRILISANALFPLAGLIVPTALLMANNLSFYPYSWVAPSVFLARCILLFTGWHWLGRLEFFDRCSHSDESAAPPRRPMPGWLAAVLPPAFWLAYLTWAMLPAPVVEVVLSIPESPEKTQEMIRHLEETMDARTEADRAFWRQEITKWQTTPQTRPVKVKFDGTNGPITRLDVFRIRLAAAMEGITLSRMLFPGDPDEVGGLLSLGTIKTRRGAYLFVLKDYAGAWRIDPNRRAGILQTRYRYRGILPPGFFRKVESSDHFSLLETVE